MIGRIVDLRRFRFLTPLAPRAGWVIKAKIRLESLETAPFKEKIAKQASESIRKLGYHIPFFKLMFQFFVKSFKNKLFFGESDDYFLYKETLFSYRILLHKSGLLTGLTIALYIPGAFYSLFSSPFISPRVLLNSTKFQIINGLSLTLHFVLKF